MSHKKISYKSRAVVTGAGSGIGRAFAIELHNRGGQVICADVDLEKAKHTARTIKSRGGKAIAVKCDVSKLEEVEELAEQASFWFSNPINVLINNAGVGLGGECIEDISMEDWQWIMDINLWGVIHGCRVFLPTLKSQRHGGIINVASAASFGSAPMMGAYNVTKSAVVALSETLQAETAHSGIHVSALCPTLVKTNVIRNARMKNKNNSALMRPDRAQSLMDKLGHTPESVVIKSLDGLDKNRTHVLPQMDARILWFFKRLSPQNFMRVSRMIANQVEA